MKSILAADLWPIVGLKENFGQAVEEQSALGQMRLQQLVENILLYDQVYIPTDDFVGLTVLGRVFGVEGLATLIDADILKFVRIDGLLSYKGGAGLTSMRYAGAGSTGKPPGMAWLPIGVAARAVFRDALGVDDFRAAKLAVKVASATKEIPLLGPYLKEIRDNTYVAVRSQSLDAKLRVTSADLDRLPGSKELQITVAEKFRLPIPPDDEVARVMRVGRTEMERMISRVVGCDDLSTLSPIGKVLFAEQQTSFSRLQEITDVPDLGASVISGAIQLQDLITLRETRHWPEFQHWFHDTCAADPARVGREYVNILKAHSKLDAPLFKTLRLLLPTVADMILPGAGTAIGAADTFGLSKLKEASPKYFIEALEQLSPEQSKGV